MFDDPELDILYDQTSSSVAHTAQPQAPIPVDELTKLRADLKTKDAQIVKCLKRCREVEDRAQRAEKRLRLITDICAQNQTPTAPTPTLPTPTAPTTTAPTTTAPTTTAPTTSAPPSTAAQPSYINSVGTSFVPPQPIIVTPPQPEPHAIFQVQHQTRIQNSLTPEAVNDRKAFLTMSTANMLKNSTNFLFLDCTLATFLSNNPTALLKACRFHLANRCHRPNCNINFTHHLPKHWPEALPGQPDSAVKSFMLWAKASVEAGGNGLFYEYQLEKEAAAAAAAGTNGVG